MIDRDLATKLKAAARHYPAVTLSGPRQCGKSTLCRMVSPKHAYANLEVPACFRDLGLATIKPYFQTQLGSVYLIDAMDLLRYAVRLDKVTAAVDYYYFQKPGENWEPLMRSRGGRSRRKRADR